MLTGLDRGLHIEIDRSSLILDMRAFDASNTDVVWNSIFNRE